MKLIKMKVWQLLDGNHRYSIWVTYLVAAQLKNWKWLIGLKYLNGIAQLNADQCVWSLLCLSVIGFKKIITKPKNGYDLLTKGFIL